MHIRRHLARPVTVLTVACSVLAGTIATSAPASAAIVATSVDDGATRGTNHFSYTGSWLSSRAVPGSYRGSFHYSNRTGATVTLTFTGTRAVLSGFKQPAGGIATVSIDGRARAVVSFSAARRTLTTIYTSPILRAGRHTVTLRVSGQSSISRRTITIDKAVVFRNSTVSISPPPPPLPAQPPAAPPPAPRPPTGGGSGAGFASLTFDDGLIGQYTNARPALRAAGLNATFYIISDGLGWGTANNMSPIEVRQLASEGDEIGNHTRDHGHLTNLSNAAAEAEFADSQAAITSQVGVTPTTCAYPYGESNSAVRAIAAKYFSTCRGTGSGTNTGSSLSPLDLRVFYVHTSTTAADVQSAASAARANGSWIIFVYHGVGAVNSADDVTTTQFQGQVQALQDSGISIRTVSQALGAVRG